jgi:hypothetical protein
VDYKRRHAIAPQLPDLDARRCHLAGKFPRIAIRFSRRMCASAGSMRPHMPSWIVVEHDACEAAHGAQRCAQIMRDRVAECFELSIGRIELNSAFLDAAFELLIETPDFVLGLLARSDIEIDSDQAM